MRRQRRKISKKRRQRIFLRDAGRCRYCGMKVKDFHLDHVTPIRWGGNDWSTNLVVSCETCNLLKSAHYWEVRPLSLMRSFLSLYLIIKYKDYPSIKDFF